MLSPATQAAILAENRSGGGAKLGASCPVVGILLVEDYEPFRRLLRATLRTRPEWKIIGEAADGLEALQKAEELQPNLVLLDIGLPKLVGLEAAHRICCLVPGVTILFVSQDSDSDVVAAAISNGAKGYVWKQNASNELLPAIEAVLRGDRFVSAELLL